MFDKKKKYMRKRRYSTVLLSAFLTAGLICGCGEDASIGEMKEGTSQSGTSQAAEEAESPAAVSFSGQDMEGNIVTSDIFGQSRLTMVNVWATYCNPCLSEMPDLGELAGEYDAGDFQLIGIISDVEEGADEEIMENARTLIEQTGADYPHLLLNRFLYYSMLKDVTGVPTTFFFDQEGNLLEAVQGAKSKDVWKEKIDGFLEDM